LCCDARLALTRIPASKTTKKIQAPLPGFGKLIERANYAHTLFITLRDDTQAAQP
jgi:hypothetical protein